MTSDHEHLFLTPAEAANRAGVSRPTITRALQSHSLKARRDNRNRWQIAPEDLAAWAARRRTVQAIHERPVNMNRPDEQLEQLRSDLMETRERLATATARADAAEADRDRWQNMAEKLAYQPRHGWRWPWQTK